MQFLFFFFFSETYTYLINKLEHIKFITELDSKRLVHGHQVKKRVTSRDHNGIPPTGLGKKPREKESLKKR